MLNNFNEVKEAVKGKLYARFFGKSEESSVKEEFKERKLALYFCVVSVIVLLLKICGRQVGQGQWSQHLSDVRLKTENTGMALWMFLVSLEWIATPVLSGVVMAVITWYSVFLDSFLPGTFPPSPLSPKKLRLRAKTFHMGYYLAVINGLIISAVMLHANITHPSSA